MQLIACKQNMNLLLCTFLKISVFVCCMNNKKLKNVANGVFFVSLKNDNKNYRLKKFINLHFELAIALTNKGCEM